VLTEEKLGDTGVNLEQSPHKSFRHLAEETGVQVYRLQVVATFVRKLQFMNVNIIWRCKEGMP
jgi:hypothetical protein